MIHAHAPCRGASQVLEQHGEVEGQQRLALTGATIDFFRLCKTAVHMQQPAKIDACLAMVRVR